MRKSIDIIVQPSEGNRDQGKVFRIEEMSASRAERWAANLFSALGRSGVDVPDSLLGSGMEMVAFLGINALTMLPAELRDPLADEMFSCVTLVSESGVMRGLVESDTEEVSTRLLLRDEVIKLHTGFSPAAVLSTLRAAVEEAKEAAKKLNSRNTRTSRKSSAS